MKFKVPESYAEILGRMDDASLSTFMRGFFNRALTPDLFFPEANREQIIKRSVAQFTATTSLKNLPDLLPNSELKALRRIIRNGGFCRTLGYHALVSHKK